MIRKIFLALGRLLELLSCPGGWTFLTRSRSRSLSSYQTCMAVKALIGEEPGTIFDVGANRGQFALAAAWRFPGAKIVSFEPLPAAVGRLRKATKRLANIEIVESALGSETGRLQFYAHSHSHASSALRAKDLHGRLDTADREMGEISVAVTTLDAFSAGREFRRPILLKLDVQGFERQVLEGAANFLKDVDYLLFETSFEQMYDAEPLFEEMREYVSGLGYKVVAPVGFLRDRNFVILQADLLWRRASGAGIPAKRSE